MKKIVALLLCFVMLFGMCACSEGDEGGEDQFTAAIMLPGVQSENATFDMYVNGIQKAMTEAGAGQLKVIEGGASQVFYARYLKELSDSEEYDIIFTATNTVTSLLLDIAAQYPDQKYAILKGDLASLTGGELPDNVYAAEFDSYEEGFLGGYYCALVTSSQMTRANEDLTVGVVFPSYTATWDSQAMPAFRYGAELANPDVTVLQNIINSWTDITKGREIARAQFAMGADIIWFTTGASGEGVILEAMDQGKYAAASDHNAIDFDTLGETIVGSNITDAETAAYKVTKSAIDGTIEYGKQDYWGAKEGIITFTWDDPIYKQYVTEEIRTKMNDIYGKLQSGEINVREYIKANYDKYYVNIDA